MAQYNDKTRQKFFKESLGLMLQHTIIVNIAGQHNCQHVSDDDDDVNELVT